MEFNEEDQKWIIAASKDLDINQMAKILKVDPEKISHFLENLLKKPKEIRTYNKSKDIKDLVTKRFVKNQIKNNISLKQTAKDLGLFNFHKLIWILKSKKLSWNELKKEVFDERNKEKSIKTTQKCSHCNEIKKLDDFYITYKRTRVSSWCKECIKKKSKETRLKKSFNKLIKV